MFKKIFAIEYISEMGFSFRIFGIKITSVYPKYWFLKFNNPYEKYKRNNVDITTLPPATGQIRDIQLANLELLKELDYVCKENNLNYWIDAGTLIGAIRHKGFIPWDDDIDTAMTREDYEKIPEAFKKSSRNPDIYADYFRDPRHPAQYYLKVQHRKCPHLFVDIFPFDTSGKKLTTEEQLDESAYIKSLINEIKEQCSASTTNNDLRKIIDKARSLVIDKESNIAESDFVWGLDFHHRWSNWFTRYDVVFPLKTINFEGIEFSCMNNPHEFLTRVYGDYMAYPKKIGFGHSAYAKLSKEEQETIKDLICQKI